MGNPPVSAARQCAGPAHAPFRKGIRRPRPGRAPRWPAGAKKRAYLSAQCARAECEGGRVPPDAVVVVGRFGGDRHGVLGLRGVLLPRWGARSGPRRRRRRDRLIALLLGDDGIAAPGIATRPVALTRPLVPNGTRDRGSRYAIVQKQCAAGALLSVEAFARGEVSVSQVVRQVVYKQVRARRAFRRPRRAARRLRRVGRRRRVGLRHVRTCFLLEPRGLEMVSPFFCKFFT